MSANKNIKGILKANKRTQKELAEYLGISKKTLETKFYRGSFSTEDLIRIAAFLELELAFVDSSQRIVFTINEIE